MFNRAQRTSHRNKSARSRPLALEVLERRELLSGSPPTVVQVGVASTFWSQSFRDFLQPAALQIQGYSIPTGSAAQSASLTWNNIDQVIITFSEDVHIDAADLSISGINVTAYEVIDFRYQPYVGDGFTDLRDVPGPDINLFVATWTLSQPFDKDRIRLDLDADGFDPVRDLDENILDGEWTNNVSTISGNGAAGGDFEFAFNVLPTDVNNTGNITSYDYVYIRQLDGKSTTSPGYIAKRDIDGSGLINSSDWQEALDRAYETLPSGSPAGATNDAPTTKRFNLVQISDPNVDVAISMLPEFGDAENGSSGLTYSILSNSNSLLFDSVSINPATKQLVLNAASGASGRATIMIRATDAGGLFVDSPVTTDVNRNNQMPEIIDFVCANAGVGATWHVTGRVIDDDDVSNLIVDFSGVFQIRSAVDENGYFDFYVILDQDDTGDEFAKTVDPHGLSSETDIAWIGLT